MKVFIAYGSAADQVTALRLQALAAVEGVNVFVPPAHTRRARTSADAETHQQLQGADFVLGVAGAGLSPAFESELQLASGLGKNMVVMSGKRHANALRRLYGDSVVEVDPVRPHKTEELIVSHLKTVSSGKSAGPALLALGTLALGLFLFTDAPARK